MDRDGKDRIVRRNICTVTMMDGDLTLLRHESRSGEDGAFHWNGPVWWAGKDSASSLGADVGCIDKLEPLDEP